MWSIRLLKWENNLMQIQMSPMIWEFIIHYNPIWTNFCFIVYHLSFTSSIANYHIILLQMDKVLRATNNILCHMFLMGGKSCLGSLHHLQCGGEFPCPWVCRVCITRNVRGWFLCLWHVYGSISPFQNIYRGQTW